MNRMALSGRKRPSSAVGQEPPALEGVRPERLAHARVVFAKQSAAFVARVTVVAAKSGERQLQRENGRPLRIVRPGAVG
jgi:hypothetical protein